ncbi:hypothetical protein SNEBB_010735 [Seison nebaliae]|nr:hypothetical protein SNEBB_010735 [Seison nebaliae]
MTTDKVIEIPCQVCPMNLEEDENKRCCSPKMQDTLLNFFIPIIVHIYTLFITYKALFYHLPFIYENANLIISPENKWKKTFDIFFFYSHYLIIISYIEVFINFTLCQVFSTRNYFTKLKGIKLSYLNSYGRALYKELFVGSSNPINFDWKSRICCRRFRKKIEIVRRSLIRIQEASLQVGKVEQIKEIRRNPKFCEICQIDQPIRCHHCKVCDKCILKRDHHCAFTGVCVGFENERYFIIFCLWATIGVALCFFPAFIHDIVTSDSRFNSPYSYSRYFFPLTAYRTIISKEYTVIEFFTILILFIRLATIFFTFLLGFNNFALILNGLTSHEFSRSVNSYNFGIRRNLANAFGSHWYVNIIFPLFWSKPKSADGINWNTMYTIKEE